MFRLDNDNSQGALVALTSMLKPHPVAATLSQSGGRHPRQALGPLLSYWSTEPGWSAEFQLQLKP